MPISGAKRQAPGEILGGDGARNDRSALAPDAGFERDMMRLALRLGTQALGRSWPNPAVGAVIADPARRVILGCGQTQQGGRPHAETVALAQAGASARGAVLYVTLEPCSHHGRTPPCADAVIAAGLARVVYGMRDPNPEVAGRGLARLQAHGITVEQSPLVEAAHWLTIGHSLLMRSGQPFVQLKLAVGADGLIPRGNGAPVWVTGIEARARAHLLRARADAILIGRGTAETDNPALTCRLPGMAARSPVRVLLDGRARLSPDARLLADAPRVPLWLMHQGDAPQENLHRLTQVAPAGLDLIALPVQENGHLAVADVLSALAHRGITRLLVEGGPQVARSFLEAGAADEILVFQGARPVSPDGIAPFGAGAPGLERLANSPDFVLTDETRLGGDRLSIYRNKTSMQHV